MMNSRTSQRRSEASMEEYIHRQNLALLKKRLAEPHSDTMHQVLLKLLAEEEARECDRPMYDGGH